MSDNEPTRRQSDDARRDVELSVVVPTFNRKERLLRVLDALGCQDVYKNGVESGKIAANLEVIVVSDGSTDGTAEAVARLAARSPIRIRLIEQPNAGAGAARNTGVEASRGYIVLFIDDDVIPEPGCLAAHLALHRDRDDLVVIGPMLTPNDVELSPWVAWEQHQLEKQYRNLERYSNAHHRQFYTGNASLHRAAFHRVGGFDTTLRRAEDVELASRLHLDGMSFAFAPQARAFHHAERSYEAWRQMAHDYGRNDVMFSESSQPQVRSQIRGFFYERHLLQRSVVRAAVRMPTFGRALEPILRSIVGVSTRLGLARVGRTALSAIYGVQYYRGVSDELGGAQAFADLVVGRGSEQRLTAWFVLEQTLGHVTHAKNLSSLVPEIENVDAEFLPIDASSEGAATRIPGWSNWTIRSGIRARRAVRRRVSNRFEPRPDAMFVHSQVPAVLLGRWMRRFPTVVSLDATPLQYDQLGEFYAHAVGGGWMEVVKKWLNRRCYRRASHLVTWSEWAKAGLVADYGVDPDKVTVIAPGVDVMEWAPDEHADRYALDEPLRVLFVGGDLERKGGHLLLEAAERLHADDGVPPFEVHLVTPADVAGQPDVVIHRGLTSNSPEIMEQYRKADIFCLPTFGDCLPMVLAEAAAAGLPLISTRVGAIDELVRDGETGRLIEAGDNDALFGALREMLLDSDRRLQFGRNARELALRDHDARANARRIVSVLRSVRDGVRA